VRDGASPRIEENQIWANTLCGIETVDSGTHPLVRANRIHDGRGAAILISAGASPTVERNEIWGNPNGGIVVQGNGTRPLISANGVRDNGGEAISFLDGATPRLPTDGAR